MTARNNLVWRCGRALRGLVQVLTGFGAAALALMAIQISLDVIVKNTFSITLPATSLVVSYYYMIIVGFLPLALAERMDGHIAVDVAFQLFPRSVQRLVLNCVWMFCSLALLFITWRTWLKGLEQYRIGTLVVERDFPVPIWPGYFAIPLGFAVFALVLVYRVVCSAGGWQNGFDKEPSPLAITASA